MLIALVPPALVVLWVASIRPYCLRNKLGYTPGATWAITIWVDWQQAAEMAKKRRDKGMIAICRAFLILQLLFGLIFLWAVFSGA